jgi:tetratricopeptide (TPR) repeat protein
LAALLGSGLGLGLDQARAGDDAVAAAVQPPAEVILKSAEVAARVDGDRDGNSTSNSRGVYARYQVERTDGRWLWIRSTGGDSPGGWVKADEVIPASAAIRYFTERIRAEPDAASAYARRAMAWLDKGEIDIAIGDYTEALELNPADPLTRSNRALAWLAKREYGKAAADCSEALRLEPEDAAIYDHRGLARIGLNEFEAAVVDFNEAIRLDPECAAYHAHRGAARVRQQQYDAARADYAVALRLDPDDAAACNALAWLLATCPADGLRNGPLAVALADRANERTGWTSAYYLGTLAAACAEAGDFNAAVRWQTRALARFTADDPDLAGHRARLAQYRAKRPHREGLPHS